MKDTKPWYYYPWVWFIIGLLATAVTASLYTVKIAVGLPNDLLPTKVSKFALEDEMSSPNASLQSQKEESVE